MGSFQLSGLIYNQNVQVIDRRPLSTCFTPCLFRSRLQVQGPNHLQHSLSRDSGIGGAGRKRRRRFVVCGGRGRLSLDQRRSPGQRAVRALHLVRRGGGGIGHFVEAGDHAAVGLQRIGCGIQLW